MKTKHLLGFAFAFAAAFFAPKAAQATTCSLPTTFVTGMVLTAANMNANPVALLSCLGSLDFNNVGAGGFYASQILPTNTAQATFGGTIPYTFPNGIISNGVTSGNGLSFSSTASLNAATKTLVGNVIRASLACNNVTDDTPAINAALTTLAAEGGGTLVISPVTVGVPCRVLGAITLPYTGTTPPLQQPIRITGAGPAWNGAWGSASNGGTYLDLRYTGGDGLHPAKIDTRGLGYFELDHLALEDNGGDNFPFMQTTNTTVNVHDNAIIGNTLNAGTAIQQDFLRLGADGYSTTTAAMTNGSGVLTISGAAPTPFTPAMVGWSVNVLGANGGGTLAATIIGYASPTQVTITPAASTTVSGTTANYLPVQTPDQQAPFQGYGSTIARNFYSHIRRGVIWGTYANQITVEDETYSKDCGSNLTNGAPYYFDNTTDSQVGNIIRGGTIELTNYQYLVSINGRALGNAFYSVGEYDDLGGPPTLGIFYFNNPNAVGNIVYQGFFDPFYSSKYFTGAAAALNTLIASGTTATTFFAMPVSFAQGLTSAQISTSQAFNADSAGYNGFGLKIGGSSVLFSDGASNNQNLYLKTPSNTGHIGLVTQTGVPAATSMGALSATTGTFSGALSATAVTGTGGDFPLVYRDSAQFTNKPIIQMSQLTASGSGGTATYNFPVAYVAPPICTTGKFGAGSTSNDAYLSSLATTAVSINNPGSASETMNVICVGQ